MRRDILNALKHSKAIFLINLSLIVILFYCAFYTSEVITILYKNYLEFNQKAFHNSEHEDSAELNEDNEFDYYRITDNYIGDQEQQLMQNPSRLIMLQNFYYLINQIEDFTFYDVTYQPMYLDYTPGLEIFDRFYESENFDKSNGYVSAKGYTIKNNFLIKNQIETLSGLNVFPDEAFIGKLPINSNLIPVFMGYDFKEYFQVGDIIKVIYFGKEFKIQILDFLKRNQYFAINDNIIVLNKYIIAPSQEFETLPTDILSSSYLFLNYIEKNNGYIYSHLSRNEVQNIITQIGLETGADQYIVIGATNSTLRNLSLTLEQLALLSSILTVILTAFTLVTMIVTISVQVREQQYEFFIHMLCGCSKHMIKLWVLEETFTILLIGLLASTLLYSLTGVLNIVGLTIALGICLFSGVTIYALLSKEIERIDMAKFTRGKK